MKKSKNYKEIKCTIIVPIKNNPTRTKHFLEESIYENFEYIFADGSINSENENLFKDEKRKNIKYFRAEPDHSREIFFKKMVAACALVKTKYAICIDQGDIPIVTGIEKCCTALDQNSQFNSASGNVFFARVFCNLMTSPYMMENTSTLAQVSLLQALKNVEKKYTYIWYSVFEIKFLQDMWKDILKHNLTHPYLEYFPTLYSIHRGKHYFEESPMLIRKIYGPRNWTLHSDDLVIESFDSNSVDKCTWNFASLCSNLFDIDKKYVFNAYYSNARNVLLPAEFVSNYTLKSLKLDKISKYLFRYCYPQRVLRVLAHYSKLVLPPSANARPLSVFSWRKISHQIDKLNNCK
jgi:glycosyltransferase domain-containing protein